MRARRTSPSSPRWTSRRSRASRRSTLRQSGSRRKSRADLPPLDASGLRTYLRLLAYARPHWRMFLLGVVGMILFAAVDIGFAALVKKFMDGAFEVRDPRMLVYMPAGIIVLFL